ncbi:hypothetical protein Q5M85_10375 [Paraclostridium bifermentans]|nr:hypothetical protein [Paraclostridium bifermentans]
MVFDSGRIKYFSIIKDTELLTSDCYHESYEIAMWNRGYGDIQLTRLFPLTYEKKIAVYYNLGNIEISDAYITLNQEMLLQDYFY